MIAKRILAVVMSISMTLSLVPASAFADTTAEPSSEPGTTIEASVAPDTSAETDATTVAATAPNGEAGASGAAADNARAPESPDAEDALEAISLAGPASSSVAHDDDAPKAAVPARSDTAAADAGERNPGSILSSLTINKTVAGTATPGVAFKLVDDATGNVFATGTTDDNGLLTFTDIPEGTYTLSEDLDDSLSSGKLPDNCYIDEATTHKVVVAKSAEGNSAVMSFDGNDITATGTVSISDPTMNAGIEFTKRDKVGYVGIPGVQFTLKKDGNAYGTYTTDSNGHLLIDGLPRGSYELNEVVPAGYNPNTAATLLFTVTNALQGQTLNIDSVSENDAETFAAWAFRVTGNPSNIFYKSDRYPSGIYNDRIPASLTLTSCDAESADQESIVPLEGVTYKVTWTGTDGSTATKVIEGGFAYIWDQPGSFGYITDKSQVKILQMPWGVYEFTQLTGPDGYLVASEPLRVVVGPVDGTFSKVLSVNFPIAKNEATFSIAKACGNDDAPVQNLVFDIYKNDGDSLGDLVSTTTTDSNGIATFENVPEGEYVIVESLSKSIAAGLDPSVHVDESRQTKVVVTTDDSGKNQVLTVDGATYDPNNLPTIHDDSMDVTVSLTTIDGLSGDTLEGAVFSLFSNGQKVGEYTTDKNGRLSVTGIPRGEYILQETNPPMGYSGEFEVEFTVTNDLQGLSLAITPDMTAEQVSDWNFQMVDGTVTAAGVTNRRNPGEMTISKYDEKNPDVALDGATFEVYFKDPTLGDGDYRLVGTVESGRSYTWGQLDSGNKDTVGELRVSDLAWGAYKLVEVTAPDGYLLRRDPIEFTIGNYDANGDPVASYVGSYEGTCPNQPKSLTLSCVDAESGKGIDGATFRIADQESGDVVFDGPVTGDEEPGSFDLAQAITTGRWYTMTQVEPPTGYRSNTNEYQFMLSEWGELTLKVVDGDGNVVSDAAVQSGPDITVSNSQTLVEFHKFVEASETGVDADESTIDPDAIAPLAGVEFLFTSVDDPTVTATAVSDANGTVSVRGLPLGDYVVTEAGAPSFVSLGSESWMATVTDGTFEGLRNSDGTPVDGNTVVNKQQHTSFDFTAVSELDGSTPVAGVTYSISRVDAQTGAKTYVKSATSDEDGKVAFDGLLYATAYVVEETDAPTGCYMSSETFTFMKSPDPTQTTSVATDNNELQVIRGSEAVQIDDASGEVLWMQPMIQVAVSKVDASGNKLAGAALELRDTEGNAIDAWTSDDTHECGELLAAGNTYTLVETSAPAGFDVADPITFTVSDRAYGYGEAPTIEVAMTDRAHEVPKPSDDGSDKNPAPGTDTGKGGQAHRVSKAAVAPKTNAVPKTGDGTDLGLATRLAVGSLAVIGAGAYVRRRRSTSPARGKR